MATHFGTSLLIQVLKFVFVVAAVVWVYKAFQLLRDWFVPAQMRHFDGEVVQQRRIQRFNINENRQYSPRRIIVSDNNNVSSETPILQRVNRPRIAHKDENRRIQAAPQKATKSNPAEMPPPKPQLTPEIVVHNIIEKVLKVSTAESSKGFYLAALCEKLSKDQILLAEKDIYNAIDERVRALEPGLDSLLYLLNCFDTASREQRKTKSHDSLFDTLMKSVVFHFGLALQSEPLALLSLMERPSVPDQLLQAVINRFGDNLNDVLVKNFSEARRKLQHMTLNDIFFPTLMAFCQLASNPHVAKLMTGLARWKSFNPNNGREIQNNSVLGPLFQFTTFYEEEPSIGNQHFGKPSKLTLPQQENSMISLRVQLNMMQDNMCATLHRMLKCERASLMEWLSRVVFSNMARSKMQSNPELTSTNGFLINVGAVCVQLCEFANPAKPKFDQLDSRYCVANGLLYDGITRISMSSEELSQWKKDIKDSLPDGFSLATEMFFITHYLLHIGYIKAASNFKALILEIHQKEKEPWSERLEDQLQLLDKRKLCQQAQLMESRLMSKILNFYAFTSLWYLELVDPTCKKLPLSDTIPPQFACLPEYIVQDMADFLLFVLTYQKHTMDTHLLGTISNFLVIFIGATNYIKNPYLRSNLVDVINEMLPQEHESDNNNNNANIVGASRFNHIFEHNLIVQKYLVPALVRFYIDIEHTGRHSQFFEKFSVRHDIAILLKRLRLFPVYYDSLQTLAKHDPKEFIKFLNMIINDSVYLLDEVLGKLPEIKELEALMEDKERWTALSKTAKQEKRRVLANACKQIPIYSKLATETVLLFNFLSKNVKEPFLSPELVDRIAQMINYFVFHLAGPKSLELKVKDPHRFNFDPRLLLSKLVEIYLHLDSQDFLNAVVRDVRSFKLEVLQKVCAVVNRWKLLPQKTIEEFEQFTAQAETLAAAIAQTENELGEVPDEFLDPITCALMEDPVILPTSGQTVDRSVIARHLLSDSIDPFNRAPLTIDMVKPNTELKAQIEEWKSRHCR